MTDPARLVAFHVLRAVAERDAYVNLVLPAMLTERSVTGRDAAFATELVHGTVRRQGTYDAVIDHVAGKGIGSIDPPVLDALRLGAHQLLSMRVPPHAAVSTTVDVVRREIGHKPVHFANALLRAIGKRDLDAWLDVVTAGLDDEAATSVRTSHPVWIVQAFRDALGPDGDLASLLEADNAPPRVTLVARPGLCDPDELPGEPGRLSPYARILASGDPGEIPGRSGRPGRRPGRGLAAGGDHARRGGDGRHGRPMARPVCRPGRQGRAAGRAGRPARRDARRERAASASGRARAPDDPRARQRGGHRARRPPGSLGGGVLRPRSRRRSVHRIGCTAPTSGGPLAPQPR